MSLQTGQQLGPYTIHDSLGAGGMGEVYRATDTRLDRQVAIKVLPDLMAHNPERVARFEREAKTLASLNHPLIAAIYGFEQADGKRFLAMELVEGPTLADRLKEGRLPVEETLDIARQIAEALEVAHDQGVIHRDLKPANIKVTPDGQVKVLDFGLAKAMTEEPSHTDPENSPTIPTDMTQAGAILGTAAYMSPEQARGKPVDKRADIWAFGCVLYESLTGDSMFRGETVTDSLGAVLHKQPEWERLPAGTPPTVQLLLRRCLAKDVKRRMRDIGDARIELEAAIADPTSSALGLAAGAIQAEAGGRSKANPMMTLVVAFVLGGAVIGAALWGSGIGVGSVGASGAGGGEVLKVYLDLEGYDNPSEYDSAVVSPDGQRVVYRRDNQLWVQDLDNLEPRQLPGTENAMAPFWSPDSHSVAYFNFDKEIRAIYKVSVSEGTPVPVTPFPTENFRPSSSMARQTGGAWTSSGIVFTSGAGLQPALWRVSEYGEGLQLVYQQQGEAWKFQTPNVLPEEQGVLFVTQSMPDDTEGVFYKILVYQDGRVLELFKSEDTLNTPVYSSSGHVVFWREFEYGARQEIWAFPYSLGSQARTGEPFRIDNGILPSVAEDQTLVYLKGKGIINPFDYQSALIDPQGRVLKSAQGRLSRVFSHALSPDGSQLLTSGQPDPDSQSAIWLSQPGGRGAPSRVSNPPEGAHDVLAEWLPDGNRYLFLRGYKERINNGPR
ncbi:MAG: protein kinase domain-containing protein, partial [Planctomycetota bacterium]